MNPEQEEQNVELDKTRKDLKIQALREKISELEDENADHRVNITLLGQQNQYLADELQKVQASVSPEEEDVPVDTDAE